MKGIKTFFCGAGWGLVLTVSVGLFLSFLAIGCDEANMVKPVVPIENGTDPVESVDPTEPTEPTEPEPEPTVAIGSAVQADDGSITVSGTSTDVPEGTTVTVTLGDTVTATATTDSAGAWTVTVSAADAEVLTTGTVTVTAAAKAATDSGSLAITEPEGPTTVTLPPGYELPPELIPATPPKLSKDEAALIEADKWVQQNHPDFDATAPKLRTQAGHSADLISLLPYKEREEVYELFVASVDLPSFAKAAQRMKQINIQLRVLDGDAERTGDWDAYWNYRQKVSIERGFFGSKNLEVLGNIYLEENPQDTPYTNEGISFYWIILEYYRLQLENPGLPNLYQKINPAELLKLFRESCQKGYVFGLDNPWD